MQEKKAVAVSMANEVCDKCDKARGCVKSCKMWWLEYEKVMRNCKENSAKL